MTLQLVINGDPRSFEGEPTLRDVLDTLGIAPVGTAVVLDGDIVSAADYAATRPGDGAEIEIVRMVGGD
jgi:sulfur carrier protein